jgi:hypothetical protein
MKWQLVSEIMETLIGEWEGKRIATVEGLQVDLARSNHVSNTKVETSKL